MDEAETSSVTGQMVLKSLLKTSMITGKRAEPEHFSRCEFTQIDALNSELPRSEISGKKYRSDEQRRSMVSGRTGHVKEFVACHETHEPIVPSEGERCDITGNLVRPGVLENCSVTGKRVLSSELESCAASGKRGIRKLFVTSSMSGARVLEEHAVRSIAGKFCSPLEGKVCTWSGRKCHPDDIRICGYTGLPIHLEYVTAQPLTAIRLQILVDLIQGVRRTTDRSDLWEEIANMASSVVGGGRCRVEAAKSAPGEQYLAVCIEIRTRLGFKVQHAGLIFSVNGREILGHIVRGKRSSRGWTQEPD